MYIALTGWSNKRTLSNFARAAKRFRERPSPPLVIASTLLVPGYVNAEAARQAALEAGLHNVRIGNRHLLGRAY